MRESPAGMSMYGLYMTCPRQWAFKYVLGFQRGQTKTAPLVHGSAVHEGKRVFYETWDMAAAIVKAKEVVYEQADVFDSLKIEEQRLDVLFEEWYNTYGKTEQDNYDIISNETEGLIKLGNGAEITLRIDQVLRAKDTGHIYIFDTKTTGWSLEGTITDYSFKAQPLLYIASVYRSTPEWLGDFRGWITDVIYQRVNYKKNGALSSMSTKCQRSDPIMYTEDQCSRFLESLVTITSEIAWAYKELKDHKPFNACFPMYRTACRNFGRTCAYWPICFQNFTVDSDPPSPFGRDPWYDEGVIQDVIERIRV